jgi:hypothetical protein
MFMRTVQQNAFLILNSVPVTFVTDPLCACSSERTVLRCEGANACFINNHYACVHTSHCTKEQTKGFTIQTKGALSLLNSY